MPSLRTQLVGVPLALITLCGLGAITRAVYVEQRIIIDAGAAKGLLVADAIALALASMNARSDEQAVCTLIDSALRDPDIAHIEVTTTDGVSDDASTSFGPVPVHPWLSRVSSVVGLTDAPPVERTIRNAGEAAVGAPVGKVRVLVSTERARALAARSWGIQAVFAAVPAVIAFGAISRWGQVTLARLGRIAQTADRIRVGVRGVRLEGKLPTELEPVRQSLDTLAMSSEASSASRRHIAKIIQSMPDTLLVLDADANVQATNRATIELLGYEQSEIHGRSISLLCSMRDEPVTPERIAELFGENSVSDEEITYHTKSGAKVPVSVSGSAMADDDGKRTGYVLIGTDIRTRKQSESDRAALQAEFAKSSRKAGMAEVATGVLHNVGNVLNSVNVSATLIADELHGEDVQKLARAIALIEEHRADLSSFLTETEQGKALPNLLSILSGRLGDTRDRLIEESEQLRRNVDHIKDIVSTQQRHSGSSSMIERISAKELIEEAMRMSTGVLPSAEVRVERPYAKADDIFLMADRHRVLQVLVNLVANAADAMSDCEPGRATLRVALEPSPDDPGMARISVSDSGLGIPSENLTKIFSHGFTTKENGHGFGLHSAALVARELDGRLVAASDGPGKGATFNFDLPIAIERAEAA
jgi:PAS domain S-box-containing protein